MFTIENCINVSTMEIPASNAITKVGELLSAFVTNYKLPVY